MIHHKYPIGMLFNVDNVQSWSIHDYKIFSADLIFNAFYNFLMS